MTMPTEAPVDTALSVVERRFDNDGAMERGFAALHRLLDAPNFSISGRTAELNGIMDELTTGPAWTTTEAQWDTVEFAANPAVEHAIIFGTSDQSGSDETRFDIRRVLDDTLIDPFPPVVDETRFDIPPYKDDTPVIGFLNEPESVTYPIPGPWESIRQRSNTEEQPPIEERPSRSFIRGVFENIRRHLRRKAVRNTIAGIALTGTAVAVVGGAILSHGQLTDAGTDSLAGVKLGAEQAFRSIEFFADLGIAAGVLTLALLAPARKQRSADSAFRTVSLKKLFSDKTEEEPATELQEA